MPGLKLDLTTRRRYPDGVLVVLAVVLALLVGGCAQNSGPTPGPTETTAAAGLNYANGTSLAIDLLVGGQRLATMAPHSDGEFAAGQLPPLPWVVEARTSTGRVLTTMTVHQGDVVLGPSETRGDAVRVTLSCGVLDIWAGPPLMGPAGTSTDSTDCNP